MEKARAALQISEENGPARASAAEIKVEVEDLQATKLALMKRVQAGDEGYPTDHLRCVLYQLIHVPSVTPLQDPDGRRENRLLGFKLKRACQPRRHWQTLAVAHSC